jgi:hypothetical protein
MSNNLVAESQLSSNKSNNRTPFLFMENQIKEKVTEEVKKLMSIE